VLQDSESGIAKVNSDEQTESDKDSNATISDGESESVEGETYDREVEAVTDVFKDARRLFPWHGRQKELARNLQKSVQEC
jgi:hypothetical protein